MDEELKQLDMAISQARRIATEALGALRGPQAALRAAAADHIASVARRRVESARRASVEVMARFSDDDIAELRYWTGEEVERIRAEVERDIERCDFWIPETSGLSPADVNLYGGALLPKPRDSRTGIPQALGSLFERCLHPLTRGLAVVGLGGAAVEAEPRLEAALARAWRAYRELAIECIAKWADVDERYHASAARFQELRWESAGEVDVEALKARLAAADEDAERSIAAAAAAAAAMAAAADAAAGMTTPMPEASGDSPPKAFVRLDSETLVPIPG